MAFPLAAVFANIFMGNSESRWLIECKLNKPKCKICKMCL